MRIVGAGPELRCHKLSIAGYIRGVHRGLHVAAEAELSDLDVELLIEHQILRFQIPMRDALAVNVPYTVEELMEVVATNPLIERTVNSDEVAQVSILKVFLNEDRNLLC